MPQFKITVRSLFEKSKTLSCLAENPLALKKVLLQFLPESQASILARRTFDTENSTLHAGVQVNRVLPPTSN